MAGALGSIQARDAKWARHGIEPDPRRDLLHYLGGEFAAGEPMQLACSRLDTTGRTLTDRMVSRLEVQVAIKALPYRLRRLMELRYEHGHPVLETCALLGICRSSFYCYQDEALAAIIAQVYEWGERPT